MNFLSDSSIRRQPLPSDRHDKQQHASECVLDPGHRGPSLTKCGGSYRTDAFVEAVPGLFSVRGGFPYADAFQGIRENGVLQTF